MTHLGYLVAGYTLTFVLLAGYAAWVMSRRRTLSRMLAEGGPEHGRAAGR